MWVDEPARQEVWLKQRYFLHPAFPAPLCSIQGSLNSNQMPVSGQTETYMKFTHFTWQQPLVPPQPCASYSNVRWHLSSLGSINSTNIYCGPAIWPEASSSEAKAQGGQYSSSLIGQASPLCQASCWIFQHSCLLSWGPWGSEQRSDLPKCMLNSSRDGNLGKQDPKVLKLCNVVALLFICNKGLNSGAIPLSGVAVWWTP